MHIENKLRKIDWTFSFLKNYIFEQSNFMSCIHLQDSWLWQVAYCLGDEQKLTLCVVNAELSVPVMQVLRTY